MVRMHRTLRIALRPWFLVALAAWLAASPHVRASAVVLKDGRRLVGQVGKASGMADSPANAKADAVQIITFVDDDLRRVFFPNYYVQAVEGVDGGEVKERINIEQRVAKIGREVQRVGSIVKVTPWDAFGHRTFSMMADRGVVNAVQGITQITPDWCKVECMVTAKAPTLIWDMRIATSSIDKQQLHSILVKHINAKNLEQRLRIVRLFLQMERFEDAQLELEGVVADFPDQKDLNLKKEVQALRQLHARSIVREIGVRRKAGQHNLAYKMLEQFPAEDVAGETLQQVRTILEDYKATVKQRNDLLAELTERADKIKDDDLRKQSHAMLKEMGDEMSFGTLDRMASYQQLREDPGLGAEEKLALALSGWLLGGDQSDTNLTVTLSLFKVRELVAKFLTEPVKLERDQIFDRLRGQEGASVAKVARLIAHMKPPLAPQPSMANPGFFQLSVPIGIPDEPDVTYYVQLPPEYDPHVRYPTILTLNGSGTTPPKQLDWWAGQRDDNTGMRLGQATRHGYIVIAIDWLREGQKQYEFSAREHAAVLGSLRDACRRFSINADRVFLTGHSIGGNAAWDLGLSHPDLWAGVIPIVAVCEKYCSFYKDNARLVPFYVLGGEKDGDKTVKNASDLNIYMQRHYDVTVTEYRGRGHEDFYEDVPHIFDWMSRRESRNFFPKEFNVSLMRSWDNYFWWFEAHKFPPRGIVDPVNFPPERGVRPVQVKGQVLATNGVVVTSAASNLTVWLSPEIVDFTKRMTVRLNGTTIHNGIVNPDMTVLLEDVRTRGDRLHPFWAKVEQQAVDAKRAAR